MEGWSCIGYPVGLLNLDLMRRFAEVDRFTRASDDIVISYALLLDGVEVHTLGTEYYHHGLIRMQPWFHGEDALHRGGGVTDEPTDRDMNAEKYEQTGRRLIATEEAWPVRILTERIPLDDKRRASFFLALTLIETRGAKTLV